MHFSDEEKHANYCRLMSDLHLLKTEKFTEDMNERLKNNFQYIRDLSSNFNMMNLEITDKRFRDSAATVDECALLIYQDIELYNRVDPNMYKTMLENIIIMVNYTEIDNELNNLIGQLKMT
jgi:hypothetical protein